jgi:hypothetical protein
MRMEGEDERWKEGRKVRAAVRSTGRTTGRTTRSVEGAAGGRNGEREEGKGRERDLRLKEVQSCSDMHPRLFEASCRSNLPPYATPAARFAFFA